MKKFYRYRISIADYYRQICEEVLEAHEEAFIAEYSAEKEKREAEEIVDVITTCITRLDIMHWYEDELFSDYLIKLFLMQKKIIVNRKIFIPTFYTPLQKLTVLRNSATLSTKKTTTI